MATKVAGELYESITGQLFEIGRQLRQQSGYPFDPEKLKKHLQDVIEGCFEGWWGWTLFKDSPSVVSVRELEIIPFLKEEEESITSEEMCRRASELGANFGQRQAEYLLKDRGWIPVRWQDFCLVFPGTAWRDSDGHHLYIPCLAWVGGQWCLLFRSYLYDWFPNDCLLRSHK